MDYCIFRSLNIYKKVNSFMISQLTNLYILAQMVDGLRFLRDMKIIHLDIKPQNMLICRGLILKITDFG
jgi:serine/threonine protein kinase